MTPTESFKKNPLREVLQMAYAQAIVGKGKERHAEDKPFEDQVWASITRAVGIGFPTGQALKKWNEAKRLSKDSAIRELLGAINYIAMAIITLMKEEK
jgi:hypothetical protein